MIGLRVLLISGLLAAPAFATTPTRTGTPAVRSTPPRLIDITGHVAAGPGCAGNLAGAVVSLSPNGPFFTTGANGRFRFRRVAYGNYFLGVSPNCPLLPCYPEQFIFVDGTGDLAVDICRDDCPATVLVSRRVASAGSLLDVSGRCEAARSGGAVSIWLDDQMLDTVAGDENGVYRGTVTLPLDASPDAEHLVRATLAGDEIATEPFTVTHGATPCVGDCNRDGTVTIDELMRGIRIALQLDETSSCWSIDPSINGAVSIEELVAAVERALNGCQLPDLVPIEARFSRCIISGCFAAEEVTQFMNVCVANQGDAESGGFYIYERRRGGPAVFGPPLPAGAEECIEMPLVPDAKIEIDAGDSILEHDETNNVLEAALPAGTACDVPPEPCTPTPPPTEGPTPSPT